MAAVLQPQPTASIIKNLPAYKQVEETKHEREVKQNYMQDWMLIIPAVEWADLVTLDLSKFDQPGGKEALAKQLFEALQTIGFFYIVNFGLSQEQVDQQFAIGKELFQLSTEEKLKYRADLEHGGYNGYKPLGLRVSFSPAKDDKQLTTRD